MLKLLLPFNRVFIYQAFVCMCMFATTTLHAAVPPNDSCGGAIPITIGSGGFALGLFTSTNTDITSATLQTGETFAPSITVAGLTKKSVWYKFTLPTTRSVRVSLLQPGSAIQAGNVGFTVYKTSICLPGNAEISTKLSPIETFGSTFHPCVADGDYYVQVTSNTNANGPVYLTVELADGSPAPYDKPTTAYQFGDLSPNQQVFKDVDIDCQSIDDANEVCLPTTSFKDYTKSIWYTFKTPAYFDYLNTWFSSINTPYGAPSIKIGYRIYQGDATTTPVVGLTQIGGCDSLITDLYAIDKKQYKCGALNPNTTYTIQLLFHKDFINTIRIGVDWKGSAPTKGPLPVSTLATPNSMGTLNANSTTGGAVNTVSDVFGCNSRHSQNTCPNSMPVNGVLYSGYSYNLSSFVSFNLAATSSIFINASSATCSNLILFRLYKQNLTTNCSSLDTNNIVTTFLYSTYSSSPLSCLAPGNYVLQVMAVDTTRQANTLHFSSLNTNPINYLCYNNGLGSAYTLSLNVRTEVASNKFDLSASGRFDKINANGAGVMQPLAIGATYSPQPDTLGCANTVLPDDDICQPATSQIYTKVTYREFTLSDSVILNIPGYLSSAYSSKIFKGDANALATSQSVFSYPQKITGLQPVSGCISGYSNTQNACLIPGTYTLANFDNRLGFEVTSKFTISQPITKFNTAAKAQDMGNIWQSVDPVYSIVMSASDTFTCYDNPLVIDGVNPCVGIWSVPATKQIYRQFYLSKPAIVSIFNNYGYPYYKNFTGTNTLFSGKATDGVSQLKSMGAKWTCFTNVSGGQCDALAAGWYTVVSYGIGSTFSNPLPGNPYNIQYSDVGLENGIFIQLSVACPTPKFNRPHKASIDTLTGQPYKLTWGPQTGHTAAYPVTGKRYTLNVENFDCSEDTIFINQSMKKCDASNVKVAFYVFQITQESYVQIGAMPYDFVVSLYGFDVRSADSSRLKTDTPLQPCLTNNKVIEFCKLQPGFYTLVIYGSSVYSSSCLPITPNVYVDKVGTSRFDHAVNAYDFGAVIPDSTWKNGKLGDVNPLDASRAPSNDFFYCTTGSQPLDPDLAACMSKYNPLIYSATNSVLHPDNTTAPDQYTIDRRNLWYTFTINQPGNVKIKVENKTLGKLYQYPFTIYKSDVDGALPFNQVVNNGMVDSTLVQGLTYITKNLNGYYCQGSQEIQFFAEPCTFKPTRYYIMVENRNPYGYGPIYDMNPNSQVEVSVLLDSVSASPPKFDHFSQANDLGLVNSGIKKGATDNFTCATRDLPDPLNYTYVSNCNKTLWYKFTTTVTGTIRYAAFFKNTNNYYYDHIQLFRQIKPNDSSVTGLQTMPHTTTYNNNGTWAQQCISPGTYYIILPGCNAVNEDVYPQIEIIPSAGDFCSAPMITSLNGPGSKVVPVTVDCHTIGTDYGEFNPTLTCPAGGVTNQYKTSWYRMDITGTDTLDVTVFINEKTNATSTDIKYRMMTGTCGAMQEQSCVQDALTRNTYKCLAPGNSYYIQVFSPVIYNGVQVTGDIDLNISAVAHADTCLPANNCIGVANFTPQFDCTKDKNVTFTNFSTFGSSIKYDWDFGYNNQKSNAVSPAFFYPALTTSKTYTVKLLVTNLLCGKKDSVTQTVTIPARPAVDLGNDTIICNSGSTITLDATSHTGTTYYWFYNGSDQPTLTVGGVVSPIVELTFNGCKARDTINIFVNPIAKRALQTKALCAVTQVTLDASRGQGEQYQWSNGTFASSITVSQPGIYWVDIYWKGCIVRDSFQVVSTSLRPLGNDTTLCQSGIPYTANATVSGATSYTWQNNSTESTLSINKAGVYWVDINLGGCTFRDSLTVAIDSFKLVTASGRICQGKTYVLPTGKVINASGVYKDSLKNSRGCDSIITTFTLAVDTVKRVTNNVSLCAGQSYTLPGGKTVSTAGNYMDTVKNIRGCDSLITTLNLTIATVIKTNSNTTICSGSSYKLPSGKSVSTSGIYIDTVKALAGCDSLITTLNLSVLTPILNSTTASICSGQTYTLPTGMVVTAAGVYRDTIRYAIGCDSLIRIVTLSATPKPNLGADKSLAICFGSTADLTSKFITTGLTSSWTLSGATVATPTAVGTAGIYQLIATNGGSCSDTALVTLTISPKPNLGADKASNICQGNAMDLTTQFTTTGFTTNWTLAGVNVFNPSAITNSGAYQIIVRNTDGCADTAIYTLTVNSKPSLGADKSTSICVGSSIDLTTQYNTTGLTSVWTFNGVAVASPSVVNAAGTYQLIASTSNGCSDTALLTLGINTKPNLGNDIAVAICAGNRFDLTSQFTTTGFTSSWTLNGATVSNINAIATAGVYQLIVTNGRGCKDTALITLTINSKPALGVDKTMSICQGNTADLTTQFTTTGLTTNWTLNGTAVANPSVVTTGGLYQLIAVNGDGCSDTALVTLTVNSKPALGADKSIAVCAGNALSLTTEFTTTGLINSWTNNGLAVNNPGAITTAGIYQLIASSSAGCKDTANVTITVSSKPNLGADKAAVICSGNTINLATQFITTGLTSNWTINGAAVTTPATVNRSGIYQLIATNSSGCMDTALFRLTVDSSLSLGADKIVSFCTGGSVNLTSQFVTTGLTSTWSLNGNTIGLPTAITASGIYRLIVLNNSGCTDTALVTVSTNVLPTVLIKDPAPVCTPATVNLTASSVTTGSTPGLSYTYWKDAAATIALPNAGTAQSGLYYIKGTDAKGCFDSRPVTVTVYTLPIVNAGRDTAICDQSFALLSGIATNLGIGTVKYLWSPASGLSNTTTARTVATPGASITYRLTATVDYGPCILSVADDVRITMQPPVTAFAGNDTVAVSGLPHQLMASGGVNYLWSPVSVLNNASVANPLATLRQDTRFTVLVTDVAGCKASATVLVKVYNGITYYLPNAFSPNGDGLNEVFRPIPAGIISTEYFRIFSRYGQLIFETSQPMKGWDGTFKGIKQPIGNYVWSIKGMGSDGKVVEKKGNVLLVR